MSMKKLFSMAITSMVVAFSGTLHADQNMLPKDVLTVMQKPAYQHARWAVYAKDLTTGKVLFKQNENSLYIPASVSKVISMSALLNEYGDDYKFKTPVYALGKVDAQGKLNGNLVLVGSGDLVFGGRALPGDRVDFVNFDHTDANYIPGATLTPGDPLAAIKSLAQQVKASGIKVIHGNVIIDSRLFPTKSARENILSPVMINENFFDFTVTPGSVNQAATIQMRPQVASMKITNQVKTVANNQPSAISIDYDEKNQNFTITGTIAANTKQIVNVHPMEHPEEFARAAFIEALQQEGITVDQYAQPDFKLPNDHYRNLKPVALFTSPPLSEYVKLILKVSHNMGANLVPSLLAIRHGKQSYEDGMEYIGQFLKNTVHIDTTSISFGDAAGGDSNYITPMALVKLLEYINHLPAKQFQTILTALPILGVDGSLADVAKNTPAQNHVFAKTGTGIVHNALFGNFLLTAKALGGFYQTKDQHWVAFFIAVNQGNLGVVNDVLDVNNDVGLVANGLYVDSNK